MKRNQQLRLLGTVAVASSLLVTQVFAYCTNPSSNGTTTVTKCSEFNGCGDDTKRITQQHGTCATYCCPNDSVTYYDPQCEFTDFKIGGTLQCCADGSQHGAATVLASAACSATAN